MNKKRFRFLAVCLTIGILCFIFSQSLMDRVSSKLESEQVLGLIYPYLSRFMDHEMAEYLIRKLAHMFEFACLGAIIAIDGVAFDLTKGKDFIIFLLCGMMTGLCDETIQIFSLRSAEIKDVWIDFLGYFCGFVFFWLLCKWVINRRTNNERQ